MHRQNIHYMKRAYEKPLFTEYDNKTVSNKQDHYTNPHTMGDYVLNTSEVVDDIQDKMGVPYDYRNDYNARYVNVKNLQFEDVHRQVYMDPHDFVRYKKFRNNLAAYKPSSKSALPVNQEVTELYNKNSSTGRLEVINPRSSRIPQFQKHIPGKLRPATAHTNHILYSPEEFEAETRRRQFEYYSDNLNRQMLDTRKQPCKYRVLYIGQNEGNNEPDNDYEEELEFDANGNIKYDLLDTDNRTSSQHIKIDKATSPHLNQSQANQEHLNVKTPSDKKTDDSLSKTSKTTYVLRRSRSAVDMLTNNTEQYCDPLLTFDLNGHYSCKPAKFTRSNEKQTDDCENFEDYDELSPDSINQNNNETEITKSKLSLYKVSKSDRLDNTVPTEINVLKSHFDDIVSQCERVCDTVDARLKEVESSSQRPIEKVLSKEKNVTIPKPNKPSHFTAKISSSVKKKQDKCKKTSNMNNLFSAKKKSVSKLNKTKDEIAEEWTVADEEIFQQLEKGELGSECLQKLMDDMINHKDKNTSKNNDKILKNIQMISTNSINKNATKMKKNSMETKNKINNKEKSKEELLVSQLHPKMFSTDRKCTNSNSKTITSKSTIVLDTKILKDENEIQKPKQLTDTDNRLNYEPNCSELQKNISENNSMIKPMNSDFATLELKRCKSYIINLIDRALSKELGTSPENKLIQEEEVIEVTQVYDTEEKNTPHKSDTSPGCSSGAMLSNPLKDSELYVVTQTLSEGLASKFNRKRDIDSNSRLLANPQLKPIFEESPSIKQLKQLRWNHLEHIQQAMRDLENFERFYESLGQSHNTIF